MNRTTFTAFRVGDFGSGSHQGTAALAAGDPASPGPAGRLGFVEEAGTRRYDDPHGAFPGGPPRNGPRDYRWAAWVSPQVRPGHRFTALVPSWNARTPGDAWIDVEARVSRDDVSWSRWYVLGRWAETDAEIRPTSVPGQDDGWARVRTDELVARTAAGWSSYQLRVVLHRRPDSTAVPTVTLLGAAATLRIDGAPPDGASAAGPAAGTELPVPAYSQMLHRGEYPHLDSGGDSWCSPTSTSMVLGTWGLGPTAEEYAWVHTGVADPFVDHAARHVFDHAYGGAGNWAFNTAYAARYGTEAFVTRLSSLAEAEGYLAAGIPLVASVSFQEAELDGAGYDTDGHLLVVVGFTEAGDVIVHDPASRKLPSNDAVRIVFDRGQFERVWQAATAGLVYVIHPPELPLPAEPAPTPRPTPPTRLQRPALTAMTRAVGDGSAPAGGQFVTARRPQAGSW